MSPKIDQDQNLDVEIFVARKQNPDIDCDKKIDAEFSTNYLIYIPK
jgi:hypothetical protein